MSVIKRVIEYLKDLKYDFAYYQSGTEKRHDDFLNVAISVLEKQIPKKIKYNEHSQAICPDCKDTVFKFYNWCPECGQRIDWLEAENE